MWFDQNEGFGAVCFGGNDRVADAGDKGDDKRYQNHPAASQQDADNKFNVDLLLIILLHIAIVACLKVLANPYAYAKVIPVLGISLIII